ncbi:MAG: MFS transporter [Planctomycetota bacterium]|jgi:MFS family permease
MGSLANYRDLLRSNRSFSKLWGAELLSIFGDWFNLVALYAAADALLGMSSAVGLVLIAKTVPVFLVSPIAGPLVERLPRRNLMILADLMRALLIGLIILAYRLESVPLLYVGVVASTCFTGLFMPARTAAIPMLVQSPQLPIANALLGATWSVTMAMGAAASGFVTEFLGVEIALVLDICTYLLSALLLLGLPELRPKAIPAGQKAGFVDGLRYLRAHPDVAMVCLLKAGMGFSAGAMPLLNEYSSDILSTRAAPAILGLLFAARGFGAAIGCLYARSWFGESDSIFRRVVLLGFVLLGTSYIALGTASSMLTCSLLLVFAGLGNSLIWVPSSVLLQWRTAEQFHGRVFALEFGIMTLVFSVAVILTTGLVDLEILSLRWAMACCGIACFVPAGI